MVNFKSQIRQVLKLGGFYSLIFGFCLISAKANAESLNSTQSFTGRINYTVTGGTFRSNADDIDA